jgi:HlyD family secretion protein
MPANWTKRTVWVLAVSVIVAGVTWVAWPNPIPVDLATAAKASMQVTVDDEGKARVRHVYIVSAPIAGKVLRISGPRHVGDAVTADETVVAVMQPTVPSFHDARTHEELKAALSAADAGVSLAEAEVRRIEAALTFARSELDRAVTLARSDNISRKALDKAKLDVETGEAGLASGKAQLEVRRSERASVAARLAEPTGESGTTPTCCIQLRAPVSGRILKINQESEGVVPAGAPLVEIGDPRDLEVAADLLSTDAVRIPDGAPVRIDGWGGAPVQGRVTRVDPAGFLKVSALGIEEQRVRTVIDFSEPAENWSRLGHDYRVIVHVTVWSNKNALTVPVAALFRRGEDWAVFVVRDGRARVTPLKLGQRNNRMAEVLSGLAEGDRVVLHPSDRTTDGVAVAEREAR